MVRLIAALSVVVLLSHSAIVQGADARLGPLGANAHPAVPTFYNDMALHYQIPPVLLYAIALTEAKHTVAGRVGPWPWTANIRGKGVYYDSRKQAFSLLNYELQQGNENFGVGPMQVHWSYHKRKFKDNLWVALDPKLNIQVGAYILAQLFNQEQNWEKATGRYHSDKNPALQQAYIGRVARNIAWIKRQAQ